MRNICDESDCTSYVVGRKLCRKHYYRVYRHSGFKPLPTSEERYWAKVDKRNEDECWLWTSANTNGYGDFWDGKKNYKATRWGYTHFIGEIPEGMLICHTCDNPPCQNPKHWFLGSVADNNQDKISKNRFKPNLGIKHGMAKLTDNNIREIRQLRKEGYTLKTISAKYNVTESNISGIAKGKTWKHI